MNPCDSLWTKPAKLKLYWLLKFDFVAVLFAIIMKNSQRLKEILTLPINHSKPWQPSRKLASADNSMRYQGPSSDWCHWILQRLRYIKFAKCALKNLRGSIVQWSSLLSGQHHLSAQLPNSSISKSIICRRWACSYVISEAKKIIKESFISLTILSEVSLFSNTVSVLSSFSIYYFFDHMLRVTCLLGF